ncbi:hypothetical protein [Lacticaseibacillus daqingensis]|uniref:hypothetical protein n=1 Tax=Lacticaseibacillus daqingensis TaxID=2486014 RepID=UPI000F76EA0F|nr:hypothetical protein [Lacticaseibacillus daqingensis]
MPNRVHPEEIRALQVLTQIEPDKYAAAVNADRPDIQVPGRVGVEVTRALERSVAALLATDAHLAARRPHPLRLHLGHTTGGPRDVFFPSAKWGSGNDLIAALTRKTRLLPGYAPFPEQNLFLFMLPDAPDIGRLRAHLRTLAQPSGFTFIYLYDQRHCWRLRTGDDTITRFVVPGRDVAPL